MCVLFVNLIATCAHNVTRQCRLHCPINFFHGIVMELHVGIFFFAFYPYVRCKLFRECDVILYVIFFIVHTDNDIVFVIYYKDYVRT